MIIGLSGYARAGKDEAAKGLVEIGFERVGFADKLRDFLYALNPVIGMEGNEFGDRPVRVQDAVDTYGWNGYKETFWGPEIRQLLQRLGTECGREIISDTIWIDAALDGREGDIVVADCRFPNEAQAIKNRGGYIVRINRPGVGPANSHPSETSLDDFSFDAVLENDGTVEQLHELIKIVSYQLWTGGNWRAREST